MNNLEHRRNLTVRQMLADLVQGVTDGSIDLDALVTVQVSSPYTGRTDTLAAGAVTPDAKGGFVVLVPPGRLSYSGN